MGRRKSAERMKLEALLSDDQWWDRDELFEQWVITVSPAVAIRAANKQYVINQKRDQRTREPSNEQKIRIGGKAIFNAIIGSMRSRNNIEERNINGQKMVRMIPEDVKGNFENFFSVIILSSEVNEYTVFDPHNRVLVLSLDICSEWSDQELTALMRWAATRESDDVAFTTAKLLAQRVLNSRNVDKTIGRIATARITDD